MGQSILRRKRYLQAALVSISIVGMLGDTIAAISTPLGEGGLAVVRISGPQALAVADRCFEPIGKASTIPSRAPSHTVHYGRIVLNDRVVDQVLLAVFRAPRSFTREDTVEISCHGGPLPAKLVLDAALAAGARLAEPGEFTRRAFLNGRLDLAQAEAVADIIHSKTELALAVANEQLAGRLSKRIDQLRSDLVNAMSHIEAHIDFPDEDIAPETREELLVRIGHAIESMRDLLRTAAEGKVLRHGVRAAIIGRPNVGKSSLLNSLLGHDRAIISPVPGTTRDTITETANIRGLPVTLIDTAGLRQTADSIESEGVQRSRAAARSADFILQVLDSSQPLTAEDEIYLAEFADRKRVLVFNKADLPAQLELAPAPDAPRVRVSCLTGEGIEQLKDAIKDVIWAGSNSAAGTEIMINSRHESAIKRAIEAASNAAESLRCDIGIELTAMDLRIAIDALGEVVGKNFTDDLLDAIFSQFCIGK